MSAIILGPPVGDSNKPCANVEFGALRSATAVKPRPWQEFRKPSPKGASQMPEEINSLACPPAQKPRFLFHFSSSIN